MRTSSLGTSLAILAISFSFNVQLLPAADWHPTDAPESIAALNDLGPTRWKDSNGDIWYISLYGPLIKDDALTHLQGLKHLTSIDLIRSAVTDAGLAKIAKLPNIEALNLSHTTITDAGLVHVSKLNKLRSLNLAGTRITDVGLAHLVNLEQLESLELAGTAVTDAGMKSLASHRRLGNLSLDSTRIKDAGLATLSGLKALRNLSLIDTATTPRDLSLVDEGAQATGIVKLQTALPNCRVTIAPQVTTLMHPRWRAASPSPEAARVFSPEVPRQIVVADDAHPAIKFAAEEFQRFFAQATGSTLPIEKTVAKEGGSVFIGASDALKISAAHVETKDLQPEDLRIRVRGNDIALVGGGPRGVLYSVYTYLEDVLGIRFLTADHTHVPRADYTKLPQPPDTTYRPPLAYRFVYYKQNMRDPEFGARMRNNVYGGQARFGGAARSGLVGHSMEHFVPTAKYGQTHPEYFALVDGKRRCDVEQKDSTPEGTQLCLTNLDVRRLIVTGVLASLKKDPKQQLISVGHSDNYFLCHCPRCNAVNDREGSTMGTMLEVVNEAADAVRKDFPDTYIGTYAYQITRRPPKHLRPRPNVVLQFATIEACQMHGIPDPHCPRNAELFADLAAWQRLTRQLFLWNYNTVFPDYMLPCPNLYNVEPNVRLFAEIGSQGAFMQCCAEGEGTDLAELRNYLISNLMWNPSRSGDKLIDEFITLHYGPAADAMRRWIALSHDKVRLRTFHSHPFGGPDKYGITPALGLQGIKLLDDAIAATDDPVIKNRLERVLVAPLRATIWEAVSVQRGNHKKPTQEQKPLDGKVAQALRPNVERFYRVCQRQGVTYIGEARPIAEERAEMIELFAAAGAPLRLPTVPATKETPFSSAAGR